MGALNTNLEALVQASLVSSRKEPVVLLQSLYGKWYLVSSAMTHLTRVERMFQILSAEPAKLLQLG